MKFICSNARLDDVIMRWTNNGGTNLCDVTSFSRLNNQDCVFLSPSNNIVIWIIITKLQPEICSTLIDSYL